MADNLIPGRDRREQALATPRTISVSKGSYREKHVDKAQNISRHRDYRRDPHYVLYRNFWYGGKRIMSNTGKPPAPGRPKT